MVRDAGFACGGHSAPNDHTLRVLRPGEFVGS